MGVVDKLNQIKSCKEDIKQAIIDKGVDMTDVAFTEYATKISEIQAGGGSGDYLDMKTNISTFYSTVESTPAYAFAYMGGLTSVNLPNCVSVSEGTFTNCSSLTSVNLPKCEVLYSTAFAYCSSLSSIDLPMCISVFSSGFYSCKSLQTVNLPNCTYLSNYVFSNCSSLTSVNLPKCEFMGGYTFDNCSSLSSIDLPMCRSISGQNHFKSCLSLQFVNLPNCANTGYYTFANCVSLSYVNLQNCMSIDGYGFQSCKTLSVLDLRSTYSCSLYNSNVFSNTPFASGNGSIYVHAAHLSQFQNATNWVYFSKCFVGVGDPDRPLLAFDNGRVYGDTHVLYSSNYLSYLNIKSSSITSVDLPNYSYVGNYMFNNCTSLSSVNLPNCSYVGMSAFNYCPSLQSIDLPNCSYVGMSAFRSCSSLSSVNLPNCEYIDYDAFYIYDNRIITIYIGTSISKVCQLGGRIFATDSMNEYYINKIYVPMSLVDAYKSAQHWSNYASLIFGI